jgi:hypothetical protein
MRYKDLEPWVIGYTFAKFWRTNRVPLRVGDKTDDSLHLIEVWGSSLGHSRHTYIYTKRSCFIRQTAIGERDRYHQSI